MSDVSKLGPLGEGEESRPLKVDLTRIDIRRGTLNLPRRFYDAFPAGEIEANDLSLGRKLTVTFVPPRELEGLGPFFEEHDLQPNDAVTIALADGLQLTPIKRERRQEREEGQGTTARSSGAAAQQRPDGHAPDGHAPYGQAPYGHESSEGGYVRERVRLEAQPLGREPAEREEKPQEGGRTRVRLRAQEPAAYLAPPVPEMKGGWQDVLHDPAPRRDQMVRPSERAVVRPDDLPAQGSGSDRRQLEDTRLPRSDGGGSGAGGHDMRQQRLFGEEPERYGTVREAPRQEGRSVKTGRGGNLPLAPRQEAEDEQPRDRRLSTDAGAGAGARSNGAPERTASAPRQERGAQAEPELAEEREPVLVGGSQAEGDLTGRIASYLHDPSTPAIVRAAAVAEQLRLPLEAVQQGLAEVSRNSQGAVAPIRQDVYLVKRNRSG